MASPSAPSAPRFEHRTGPGPVLGLSTDRPRLSWTVASAPDGYVQAAYELEIDRNGATKRFMVESTEQVLVPWPDESLGSRESVTVRIRVRDAQWSHWSEPATAEAGLLDPHDWQAQFISPISVGGLRQPAPALRGEIYVPSGVVRARLFATAHGMYKATLNGAPIDDVVLAPGWTSYQHRLRYRAVDVTHLVQRGRNTLEVTLGNGWWRGRLGYLGKRANYGERLALLAQLEFTTDDGQTLTLASDDTWVARPTGILADDIYDGQTTDLRIGAGDFTAEVETVPFDFTTLVGEDGPPMRITETVAAQHVWSSPSGRTLVDFGQNLVGWVRLRTRDTAAGAEVVVRHAEVLEHGELGTEPLRSARATDTYFLAGNAEETLEPTFTFHGFRFAEVAGILDLRVEDLEAVVIGSDLRRTGWFSSSDELLDRFHENVVWGMRGNFLDVPTDCPQRDERLGWTGDIQVFSPTATYLFDTAGFLTSWLADLAAEQTDDGRVPHVVPDILRTTLTSAPTAAWGDAATVVPWTLWQRAGDKGVLARQFASMRAWVDHLVSLVGPDLVWRGGFQYGDWLDPTAPADDAALAKADPDVVATAHFAHSATLVARAAEVLGHAGEAADYEALAARIRRAFTEAFVTPSGRILSEAQTVYALALQWDLLELPTQREAAGARLADLVRAAGFRIATGFVGTPLICDALTDAGYPQLAHRLLLQTRAPSWLYPVTTDATTVWERWDSLLPDGTIHPSGMTSFNHYALGSVVEWVHRRVAGLAPGEPGYRTIIVRPEPPIELDHATARHVTPYGEASVSWRKSDRTLTLDVRVPVGARAVVALPWNTGTAEVGHGHHSWTIDMPLVRRTPVRTVRELLDDAELWDRFSEVAVSSGIAPTDVRLAQLLAPYFDRPVSELPKGVWTKSWPSDATMAALAAVLRTRDHDVHRAVVDREEELKSINEGAVV